MKYILLFALAILTFTSFGQEVEKIIFTSQKHDEPPTKQGRPKYKIEFLKESNGDFTASVFYINRRKKKLKDRVRIEKERVEKITEWRILNKKTFSLSDLELDISELTPQNDYKLNFDIPTNLTVEVDSFRFCKSLDFRPDYVIGGQEFSVTLVNRIKQTEEFVFESNLDDDDFNLKNYIFFYELLKDKIPEEVPDYGFFSKSRFYKVILYYQMTVECEGFYYREYISKNPQITDSDRRMMIGWDFVKYLKERNNK
ncbi:hypothetical protein [Roseivirga sp.]|uniref:hypothetical protein n=1 Tax=Roseivirga sp. TaxID=1964215 RepID=UPI003B52C913